MQSTFRHYRKQQQKILEMTNVKQRSYSHYIYIYAYHVCHWIYKFWYNLNKRKNFISYLDIVSRLVHIVLVVLLFDGQNLFVY